MTSVTFVSADGAERRTLQVKPGQSFMQAAVDANLKGIEAECGGCLTCATCHVYVEEGGEALPPASAEEVAMLDFVAAERRENSRLSCQLQGAEGVEGVTVWLPVTQV